MTIKEIATVCCIGAGNMGCFNAIKAAIERAKADGNRGALITSGKKIAETAAIFKTKTSIGLDLWSIKELCQCMPEDLDRLAELMMEWGQAITAPAQWLVNFNDDDSEKERPQNGGRAGQSIQSVHWTG